MAWLEIDRRVSKVVLWRIWSNEGAGLAALPVVEESAMIGFTCAKIAALTAASSEVDGVETGSGLDPPRPLSVSVLCMPGPFLVMRRQILQNSPTTSPFESLTQTHSLLPMVVGIATP